MTRITYSSLHVGFTIGASSRPTQTQVAALITTYYKLCYRYLYGIGSYSADESTDPENIIDSDEFREELAMLVSHKVDRWHEAGISSDGRIIRMPKFNLFYDGETEEEQKQFVDFLDASLSTDNEDPEIMDNIRISGSDYSDYSGVFY